MLHGKITNIIKINNDTIQKNILSDDKIGMFISEMYKIVYICGIGIIKI